MGGNICCCKGAEPVEEVEQVPEKTNRIMLQYDEADADKLTNFGAKLSTNSEGEHRLVEVKKDGLAKQLHLKNDDVIIELNGADVTDVCHESLLLSLHDLGTQVQFVVNRRNEGTPQQGRVYFRLGPVKGDVGGVEARIAYEKHEFIDESSPSMQVFVNAFVLSTTEAFETLGIYVLDSAQQTTLQITKESVVKDLDISGTGALFVANPGTCVNVCMYEYTDVYSTGPSSPTGTVTAFASNSVTTENPERYGLKYRVPNGPLLVEDFPDCMKTKLCPISANRFFFLLNQQGTTADITPMSNWGLHVTSNSGDQAVLSTSINSMLEVVNTSDCTQQCALPGPCNPNKQNTKK